MFPTRPIVGFLARFFLVFVVLTALWPMVSGTYCDLFRSGGDILFGGYGSVRFRTLPEQEGMDDTKVFVRNRNSRQWAWITISSKHVGYTSTAVLTALIIATPVGWTRRVGALGCGHLLLHGFIALRLLVFVRAGPAEVVDTFWNRTIGAGLLSVSTGQGVSYIVPILIWIVISFRREDLESIMPGSSPSGEYSAQ